MKKVLKALPILWFVCGLALAAASWFGYRQLLNSNDNAEQMTHQIQTKEQTKQQLEAKNDYANFDPSQVKATNAAEFAYTQLHYEEIVNQWGIGSLYIPSAGIQTKILAGMENNNLMVAVGTYYPDQRLGEGNYVLLAHNLVEGGGALSTITNTNESDVIYATDFEKVYEYQVTKNTIVNQSNGQLLDKPSEEKNAIMTLFRCEGGLNTPNRAVVQGEFTRSYPANEATEAVKVGLGLGNMKEDTIFSDSTEQLKGIEKKEHKQAEKQFKQKQPKYSTLEKLCIGSFSLINQYPIEISITFLIVLVTLERLSKIVK